MHLCIKKNHTKPYRDLIDLLIANNSFKLATRLINLVVPDKSLVNKLLRPWAEKIMDSSLKNLTEDVKSKAIVESEVADKIKKMFFRLASENSSLRTSEILDIAELALHKKHKLLARKLLQVENPPILKIGFFLKMEDFEAALEEAIHCFDSHYIYLIFKKFTSHLRTSKHCTFTLESLSKKIQSLRSSSLMKHLLEYLSSDCVESREKVVSAITSPEEFLILSPVLRYLTVEPGLDRITGNERRKFFNANFARVAQVAEDALYRIKENQNRQLKNFLEKDIKNFFVGMIQAKVLDCNLIRLRFKTFEALSHSMVLLHICENSEKYHSSSKCSEEYMKEFRRGSKVSDWEVSLARVKLLLKRKDIETAVELINNFSLSKVKYLDTLYLLFCRAGSRDSFIDEVLTQVNFKDLEEYCQENFLFYEFSRVSLLKRKDDKFNEYFNDITDNECRNKLRILAQKFA